MIPALAGSPRGRTEPEVNLFPPDAPPAWPRENARVTATLRRGEEEAHDERTRVRNPRLVVWLMGLAGPPASARGRDAAQAARPTAQRDLSVTPACESIPARKCREAHRADAGRRSPAARRVPAGFGGLPKQMRQGSRRRAGAESGGLEKAAAQVRATGRRRSKIVRIRASRRQITRRAPGGALRQTTQRELTVNDVLIHFGDRTKSRLAVPPSPIARGNSGLSVSRSAGVRLLAGEAAVLRPRK